MRQIRERTQSFVHVEGCDTYIESTLACDENTQTRWCAETLLAGSEDDVKVPIIEPDFFRCNGAYGVNDNLCSLRGVRSEGYLLKENAQGSLEKSGGQGQQSLLRWRGHLGINAKTC